MTELEATPPRSHVRRNAAVCVTAVAVLALAVTAGVLFGSHAPRTVARAHEPGLPRIGQSEPPRSAHDEAVRLAVFLVRDAPMAPGAEHRDRAPAKMLAQPGSVPGAQHVQRTRFWTAAGTVGSTIAYLQAHPPAGMTAAGSGTAGGPGVPPNESLYFQSSELRSVDYTVIAFHGGVAVRVDAQVLWAPIRDPADDVPASPTSVDVLLVRRNPQLHQGAPTVHHILTGAAARRLAAFVNRLPRAVPTNYVGCPADMGGEKWFDRVVFHSRTETARLLVDMVGCATATLQVGDRKPIQLSFTFSAAIYGIERAITSAVGLPANYG